MPATGTCPDCGAPEGCRTGVYYAGKWRERRSIDCYERQIKNLTEQLAAKTSGKTTRTISTERQQRVSPPGLSQVVPSIG
jgi:hypothetical protein